MKNGKIKKYVISPLFKAVIVVCFFIVNNFMLIKIQKIIETTYRDLYLVAIWNCLAGMILGCFIANMPLIKIFRRPREWNFNPIYLGFAIITLIVVFVPSLLEVVGYIVLPLGAVAGYFLTHVFDFDTEKQTDGIGISQHLTREDIQTNDKHNSQ